MPRSTARSCASRTPCARAAPCVDALPPKYPSTPNATPQTMPATTPRLKPPLRACMTATSSTSMRCGWAIAGTAAAAWFWNGCTTAASGLFGSSAGARVDGIIGFGIPEGGGTDADGGGTGVSARTAPHRRRHAPARERSRVREAEGLPRPVPPSSGDAISGRSWAFYRPPSWIGRDLTCLGARMSTRPRRSQPQARRRHIAAAATSLTRSDMRGTNGDPRRRRMLTPAVPSRPTAPTPTPPGSSSSSPSHLASGEWFGPALDARRRASRPRHRQLRLVHLQPRPVPRRAGRAGRGLQERRHRRRRHPRARSPTGVLISPGPCTPERGGHLARAARGRSAATLPDLRRVPRAPGHRAGLRRPRRPRRRA